MTTKAAPLTQEDKQKIADILSWDMCSEIGRYTADEILGIELDRDMVRVYYKGGKGASEVLCRPIAKHTFIAIKKEQERQGLILVHEKNKVEMNVETLDAFLATNQIDIVTDLYSENYLVYVKDSFKGVYTVLADGRYFAVELKHPREVLFFPDAITTVKYFAELP